MLVKFVLKVQITCSLRSLLTEFLGQISTLTLTPTLTLTLIPNPKTLTLNNPNPNPNPFWTLLDWDLQGVGPCGTGTYREWNPKGKPENCATTYETDILRQKGLYQGE
jgi:hypothetical protein